MTASTHHLRRSILAELANGEATSHELARRLLGETNRSALSLAGQAAAALASRGQVIRTTTGRPHIDAWAITDLGRADLALLTGSAS